MTLSLITLKIIFFDIILLNIWNHDDLIQTILSFVFYLGNTVKITPSTFK